MELGISMFGDNHYDENSKPLAAGVRLRELMDEIKLMDDVGLDFFGIGEHHRPDYAVSVPEIILASAATITRKIKLGSAVTVLSSSDPVRIYQSFATIDHISNGRSEITAGRGSFTESFPLYGYDLADYDELFEEKLNLLVKINNENPVSWNGNHRAALNNQQVLPRASTNHLDIWIAIGGTPESVSRAAKLGLPVVFAIIGGNPIQFKPLFDYYKDIYLQEGHDLKTMRTGVHMHCFVGENSKQTADDYYPVYSAQMNRIGRTRGWPPYSRAQFDLGRSKQGAYVIGDANEAIDKILYLHEVFGLTRFSAHMDVGGPSHKSLMKSIELFGSLVAPKVRQALNAGRNK